MHIQKQTYNFMLCLREKRLQPVAIRAEIILQKLKVFLLDGVTVQAFPIRMMLKEGADSVICSHFSEANPGRLNLLLVDKSSLSVSSQIAFGLLQFFDKFCFERLAA